MATSFWSGGYFRTTFGLVTDVQTIIDEIIEQLTVDLPVAERWTLVSANRYKSVADAAGCYLDVHFTRVSATALAFTLYDPLSGGVVSGAGQRIDITSGAQIEVMCGAKHICVTTNVAPNPSYRAAYFGLLDVTPEAPYNHYLRVAMKAPLDGNGNSWSGGAYFGTTFFNLLNINAYSDGGDINRFGTEMKTVDGSDVTMPVKVALNISPSSSSVRRAIGYAPQLAYVDIGHVEGSLVQVPLDVGEIGNFYVLPFGTAGEYAKLAVRVP